MTAAALESVLKRDRAVVLASLGAMTVLAWAYLLVTAAGMGGMGEMAMARIEPWSALDFAAMSAMWAIMMVGMMLPSAAPMILLYAAIRRKQSQRGHAIAPTGAFASGYLIAWAGFSLAATTLQWGLEQTALLSPMMVSTSAWLGGGLLIFAGVYQWTPLKHACLEHCRSPVQFLSRSWRKGTGGAVTMGLHHGAYCVGCCWVLMGLLFVGGVMNLLWVAAIAAFVLVEKLAPFGHATARVSGLALLLAGGYLIWQG
jgi:predicted metal-binding membrane protein